MTSQTAECGLVHGKPIHNWRMTRSQELFFLLLERPRPLSKDQLIDTLWPDVAGKQIDTTMRTAIYYLRQAIGKGCVVYESGLYSLNLEAIYGPEIWCDAVLFEEYYRRGKQALEEHEEELALAAFTNLVALYTGEYLHPFYNDWCIPRRNRLQLAYMDAHEQLAKVAWQRECWEVSIEHWNALLSLDPCFEKAHYWIMRAYLQQEKRELALRQYQRCCHHLQEDLQTKPRALIQELYQRIR